MHLKDPLQQQNSPATGTRVFAVAMLLSLVIHGAAGAYLLWRKTERMGAIELPTRAISVNIEASDVLDAVESSASNQTAAGTPGLPADEAPAPAPEVESAVEPPPPEPEIAEPAVEEAEERRFAEEAEKVRLAKEAKERRLAEEAEKARFAKEAKERDREASRRQQEQAKARAEAEARRKAEQRRRAARERERRKAAQSGAGGGGGSSRSPTSSGRISASRGSLRNYGAMVRSRIARRRPRGAERGGRVVILLSIAPSGRLRSASIVRSSGNPSLDRAVLSAVRSASPFPPPPGGASPRYTIPFQFR